MPVNSPLVPGRGPFSDFHSIHLLHGQRSRQPFICGLQSSERRDRDGSDSVWCRSELSRCCSEAQGDLRGDWFFPSGERLPFPGPTNDPFESRGAQAVDLRRKTANSPSGIYRCDIAVNARFYVGIYANGGMYIQ